VAQPPAAQLPQAESVLLAVAGFGPKDQVVEHDGMSEAEFVAANKRRVRAVFDVVKMDIFSMIVR
jgi:hypothetical protein